MNTYLMPEDLMEGHSFGDSGIKIKQELKVREKTSIIFRKDILDFIVTTTMKVSKLYVQCEDTKQTMDKLPPPFIYYRCGILALLLFFYTKFFEFLARARSPVIYLRMKLHPF